MNRRARIVGVYLVLALMSGGCARQEGPGEEEFEVAVLFAPSGKGDRSYNDMALSGVAQAPDTIPLHLVEIQPTMVADYEPVLRNLASTGTDLIIGVGFLYADPINRVAPAFPATRFLLVDGDAGALVNVRSLVFRPEEGSFLVGVVAAEKSVTQRIGFIAGMDIPIMHRFECGFVQGAQRAAADHGYTVSVTSRYIGSTPDAFSNPARGRDLALLLYDDGIDVLYHAAGASGNGVIQAAQQRRRFVIGVDTDQSYLAPEWVITSMRKRIDIAVARAISDVYGGTFAGGTHNSGLREGGVDYVVNPGAFEHIPPRLESYVDSLRALIIEGVVAVCE